MKRIQSLRAPRALLAIALVAALFPWLSASVPVSADTCTSLKVTYYEDTSGGGDYFTKCDQPLGVVGVRFADVPHTPEGACNSPYFKLHDEWNDCISSVRITLASDRCLFLDRNTPPDNDRLVFWGPMTNALWNITGLWPDQWPKNDSLSAARYGHITPNVGISGVYCKLDTY